MAITTNDPTTPHFLKRYRKAFVQILVGILVAVGLGVIFYTLRSRSSSPSGSGSSEAYRGNNRSPISAPSTQPSGSQSLEPSSPILNYAVTLNQIDGDTNATFSTNPQSDISLDLMRKVDGDPNDGTAGNDAGKVMVTTVRPDTVYNQFLFGESVVGFRFGQSVSIDAVGRTLVVGAPGADVNGDWSGSVYVYYRDEEKRFEIQQRLDGTSINHEFGHLVYVSPNGLLLAVSSPGGSVGERKAGSVRLFSRDGILESFREFQRFNGECEGEDLGVKGLTIDTSNGTVFIHAKAIDRNDCITNDVNVRSYEITCSCIQTNSTCNILQTLKCA